MEKFNKALNVPSSLEDILDLKNMTADALFYRYKDKKDIGKNIFKELIRRFDAKTGGFYMDDASREIGLLSQSQSLQSLLLLTSSFGLDFDEVYEGTKQYTNERGEKESLTIRMIMDIVIEDIIRRLSAEKSLLGTGGEYVFDSSPYMSTAFDTEYAYIDCITWVIPTFLLVLRYHVEIGEICKFEPQIIDIIKVGLRFINEAYINGDAEASKNKLTCGWNFTKDCEEPSLYFTFAVSECYVDLFNAFDIYLADQEALRDSKNGIPLDAETRNRIDTQNQLYKETLSKKSTENIKYKKGTKAFFGKDRYNELKRLFIGINDGDDGFGGVYGELEKKCKDVAAMVWFLVKDKFADYFFFNDLHATITEDDIKMSTTNDALFNSVYIINILLDAGLDEDINKRITKARILEESANDENRAKYEREITAATREYNNLLETCQFALQKALRTYENLKNDSREYIVDQFLVGFNEKLERLESKVRELRKLRIRVFSLLPLFIKTNSVISEYLVKYPQNSMKKYLGYILENRYVEKQKESTHWIWEADGYFSASNYYYVSALGEFYSYYEEYEEKYVDDETHDNKVRNDYLAELKSPDGEIGKLTDEIDEKNTYIEELCQEKDKEIAALQKKLADVDTPVEDAVRELIEREINASMAKYLCEFFNGASDALTKQSVQNEKADQIYLEFKAALSKLFVSMLAPSLFSESLAIGEQNSKKDGLSREERYNKLVNDVMYDFDRVAKAYIHGVGTAVSKEDGSKLLGMLGSF